MTRPAYPHDLDLGAPLETGTFTMLLQSQRDSELVRGFLQLLRTQAAMVERAGRQTPAGANPLEYRAYHAGGADALEEMLMQLYVTAHPGVITDGQMENEDDGVN
jgi:hypothetical protein